MGHCNSKQNLTKNTEFEDTGYIVTRFLEDVDCEELRSRLMNILSNKLKSIIGVDFANKSLLDYHKFVSTREHLLFTGTIYKDGRGFFLEYLIIN